MNRPADVKDITIRALRDELKRCHDVLAEARQYAAAKGDDRLWNLLFVERPPREVRR